MRNQRTQRLVLAALFAALTAVCAQISLPLPPVPASLAVFSVLLCGASLGPRWGALAIGGYVVMGAIGLPVFAGFRGGPNVLFGATGGYLIGYILCAYAVGALARRLPPTAPARFAAIALCRPLCYVPGTLWMMLITRADALTAALSGMIAFIPGDLLKALLAAMLSVRLMRALPLLYHR
ncbi:MAG: biotin transporter BioY [Clostridia bacterium]|nr:biotin transporter BioY [Clostridia bacterium]